MPLPVRSRDASVVVQLLIVAVTVTLASVALELLYRTAELPLGTWLVEHPVPALINAAMFMVISCVIVAIVGRALTATLISLALMLVLGLAHASTLKNLGRPLFPWDLMLFREAWAVLPFVTERYGVAPLVIAAVALVVGLGVSLRVGPRALGWRPRAALLLLPVLLSFALLPRPSAPLKTLGVRHRHWEQPENYRENGLLLTFVMNLPAANVQKPAEYERARVQTAINSQRTVHETFELKPDVIVVMSESLFDPTRLPGLTFEQDPLPTVHRLQREAASGSLYPPTFGGGTANTEFEFLTGHSMRFLPPGSVPYQQYLRRKQRSMASIFAANGYRTEAAHIYHRWFWERDAVYQHLGFQRFTTMEQVDLGEQKLFYPPDALLTKEIMRALTADHSPLFMFGISVEAHGPYEPNRYEDAAVHFSGPLDDDARAELSTYVEAISHADHELALLIEFLEKRGRPAVLVFFGDHLPSLPRTLRQTGVVESIDRINGLEPRQRAFLYEVPLLVWSNVKPGQRSLGAMSSTFLGPLILEETGTPGTPYMDFLDAVRRRLPVVSPHLISDADGVWHEAPPTELRALADDWWTLEYDALFGDDFVSEAPSEG